MRPGWWLCVAACVLVAPIPSASAQAFQRDPGVADVLGELSMAISGSYVYSCVDQITTDVPHQYRLMNTPTHDLFVEKYGRVFEERFGFPTQVVAFETGGAAVGGVPSPVRGGHNILGVLPGRDLTQWVVVGGHYDTRELTVGGGAYDNTSGICTVLALANAYKQVGLAPAATIVFAWWDGEEWGLYGSRAFLADHNATKRLLGLTDDAEVSILAAFSFDMVGLNYPAMNTWLRYGDPTAVLETAILNLRTAPTHPDNFTLCPTYGCYKYERYTEPQLEAFVNFQALVREVAHEFLDFPPQHVRVYDDQYGRSDHVPFIAAGIPGMRIQGSHDEQYPHYHMPTDTLPNLVALAGSETHLRSGFDKAADVGGLAAAFVALTGSVGRYGGGDDVAEPAERAPARGTPALEIIAVALAVTGAAWLGRRR
jgi:hypothetical protein